MNLNQQIAILTIRLLLGLVFFFQGFGKVFKFGMDAVYQNFFYEPYKEVIPAFVLKSTAYYTSFAELLGGVLLVIGLFRNYTLYVLASVLVIVSFGHGIAEPIWNLSHVMYRTTLLVSLLLLPEHWDRFAVDRLVEKKRGGIGFKK